MLYRAAKIICQIILVIFRRWEIHGSDNLPSTGGVVIISNHVSYWDPVVVGCAVKRRVYFMAKAELFKIPLLGWIITRLGAFPVRRNAADPVSLRRSLQLLKGGRVIGIFPEGTRSHSGEVLEPHPGAAMLALKTGVPIVPVGLTGTRGLWRKVKVFIGRPMEFPALYRKKITKEELEQVSIQVMNEVRKMIGNNNNLEK